MACRSSSLVPPTSESRIRSSRSRLANWLRANSSSSTRLSSPANFAPCRMARTPRSSTVFRKVSGRDQCCPANCTSAFTTGVTARSCSRFRASACRSALLRPGSVRARSKLFSWSKRSARSKSCRPAWSLRTSEVSASRRVCSAAV
ncbi:hypothetical protein SDC9_203930 [bioreactor metagenome]|uniref:Uncharacterized protein n=1 Tax=bioreactor metagenome TaxID=1076179 RepID=A0A645J6Z6_9ZZZZ